MEFVILEKIVGSLSIPVGRDEPSAERSFPIIFQDLLRALDPLSVEKDRLVVDRFYFCGEGGEIQEVGLGFLVFIFVLIEQDLEASLVLAQ